MVMQTKKHEEISQLFFCTCTCNLLSSCVFTLRMASLNSDLLDSDPLFSALQPFRSDAAPLSIDMTMLDRVLLLQLHQRRWTENQRAWKQSFSCQTVSCKFHFGCHSVCGTTCEFRREADFIRQCQKFQNIRWRQVSHTQNWNFGQHALLFREKIIQSSIFPSPTRQKFKYLFSW